MDARQVSQIAVCGLAAALSLLPALAAADTVGTAAAVKPSSTGTPPGSQTRTLQVGTEIAERERIQTTGSGSLQVMFLDKSTLNIGPNSDLLIDQFVYDPSAGTGQFAANLTKGALRFVGGQISHTAGATINTPAATVGIRGGAALITHDSVCQANNAAAGSTGNCTKVVCLSGVCTVESLVDSQNLQLGISQAVEIGALGATAPFTVTSVNLGDNTTTGGPGGNEGGDNQSGFSGQETIDRTVNDQTPEPVPPSPPPDDGGEEPPPPPPPID